MLQLSPASVEIISPAQSPSLTLFQSVPISELVEPPQPATTTLGSWGDAAEIDWQATRLVSVTASQWGTAAVMLAVRHTPPLAAPMNHRPGPHRSEDVCAERGRTDGVFMKVLWWAKSPRTSFQHGQGPHTETLSDRPSPAWTTVWTAPAARIEVGASLPLSSCIAGRRQCGKNELGESSSGLTWVHPDGPTCSQGAQHDAWPRRSS